MRPKTHIRLKLRHALTILFGGFLFVGGLWVKGQAVSWAAPEQSPNQQTVPPRPPTPVPTPPQDDPSDGNDDGPSPVVIPPSAPGPLAGTETPPPLQFPEPTPGDDDLTPVPTTETLPTQTPAINPPAGGDQLPAEADLSLAIFVDNGRPFVSQAITYTVVMSNSGPSNATNVAVSHSLPAALMLSRVEPTHGSFNKVSRLWLVPGLQVRQVVTLTLVATITQAGLLTSTTEITAVDQFDPDSTPANGLEDEDDLDRVTVFAILKTPVTPEAEPHEPAEASRPVSVHIEEAPSGRGIFFDLLGSRLWICALGLGLLLIFAGVFLVNTLRRLGKLISFIVVLSLILSNAIMPAYADTRPLANCRLGAGGVQANVVNYNLKQLNIGLYLDWRARSSPPAGLPPTIEYIQVVRVHQNKVGSWNSAYAVPPSYSVYPDLSTLASWAANQPGMLWLIGNEIERRDWDGGGQDEITPELYARAFHQIQAVIKAADPTARIGIGGVIQATPLRLQYLDRVWASHLNQYGYSMGQDIDVWNVHNFVLREVLNQWGADIPAGLDATHGILSQPGLLFRDVVNAHYDLDYFRDFIEAFRSWMASKGERNKPLIISEYGPLLEPLKTAQMTDFMAGTFDYMLYETNATTGFPADENRLVQQWVWYSVNDNFAFTGALFNSTTHQLTAVGNAWKTYVTNQNNPAASEPQTNLHPVNLQMDPSLIFLPESETGHATLKVDIANSGNIKSATGDNIIVKVWDGPPTDPGSQQIGSTQVVPDIPGCGGFITVEIEWSNINLENNQWYVEVAPIATETNITDNIASSQILVIDGEAIPLYLPIVLK